LLITEDLHRADSRTLQLIDHFAGSSVPTRILWVGTFRLTQAIADQHPLISLRQELRLHPRYTEILLEPFSEKEVAEYVATRIPQTHLTEKFVDRIYLHTDGVPLFVTSLLDLLIEHHAASAEYWSSVAPTVDLPVPDSLAGPIEKQLARLPPDSQ